MWAERFSILKSAWKALGLTRRTQPLMTEFLQDPLICLQIKRPAHPLNEWFYAIQ